jgi:hypothetical protein
LQTSKLKLLHGSFRAPQLLRDFANTSAFGKSQLDHSALIVWKPIDKPEEPRALFEVLKTDLRDIARIFEIGNLRRLRRPLGSVTDYVRGYPYKPRGKGHSTPGKSREVFQRLLEDFGSQVLSHIAVSHTPGDIRVDELKVVLVKHAKFGRISLRSLHQEALIRPLRGAPRCGFSYGHFDLCLYKLSQGGKVTVQLIRSLKLQEFAG